MKINEEYILINANGELYKVLKLERDLYVKKINNEYQKMSEEEFIHDKTLMYESHETLTTGDKIFIDYDLYESDNLTYCPEHGLCGDNGCIHGCKNVRKISDKIRNLINNYKKELNL